MEYEIYGVFPPGSTDAAKMYRRSRSENPHEAKGRVLAKFVDENPEYRLLAQFEKDGTISPKSKIKVHLMRMNDSGIYKRLR